jgi:hypothetical protein
VLSSFGRNLTSRHLVGCFNAGDASAKACSFKTFFQFIEHVTQFLLELGAGLAYAGRQVSDYKSEKGSPSSTCSSIEKA